MKLRLFFITFLMLPLSCNYFKDDANKITANGNLEFTEIAISSEVGGKIEKLFFEEGKKLAKGELMATINSDILATQKLQAEAQVLQSKAKLASLVVGARKQEIAQAEEMVSQAEEVLQGSKKAVSNSLDLYQDRTNQQQQLDLANTQYQVTKEQYNSAQANLAVVKNNFENAEVNYLRSKKLYDQGSISKQQFETTETQFNVLKEQLNSTKHNFSQLKNSLKGAEVNLNNMKNIYANRLNQKQLLDNSNTQLKVAETNLKIAKAKLDLLISPAKREELEALKAGVKQAEATLKLAELQLSKSKIYAPMEGMVLIKNFEQGELVLPNTSLAVVSDTSKIWLKVYIPETQIGQIKLGQKVNLSVDSFKDKTFEGTINFISPKAEFTPKNVQTKEERVNQVFAVKIFVPNKSGLLKAGMPADVEIIKS